MTTIQVSNENWKSVVDMFYSLYYDYLLRVSYSRIDVVPDYHKETHIEEGVTLEYPFSQRHYKVYQGGLIGIWGGKAGYFNDISLPYTGCTINYDLVNSIIIVRTVMPTNSQSEHQISRIKPLPDGNLWEYLSLRRYDSSQDRRID